MCMRPTKGGTHVLATNEQDLRRIFEDSRFASLAPFLILSKYFPRSPRRVLFESARTTLAGLVLCLALGAVAASIILSFQRHTIGPFGVAILALLPFLGWARRNMTFFHATSEGCKFPELLCFDERRPFVYLRRFEGEDPLLPTILARSQIVTRLTHLHGGAENLENLSQMFDICGPVVGLGRPDDDSIGHRIIRLFVPDTRWREAVNQLLNMAKGAFVVYDTSDALDWELTEALNRPDLLLFVMITGIGPETAADAAASLAALPLPIRDLPGRSYSHAWKPSPDLLSDRYALMAAITPDSVRVYGIKLHWHAAWKVLFKEILHQKIDEHPRWKGHPPEYNSLIRAVDPTGAPWFEILAAIAGFAATYFAVHRILS